MEKSDLGERFQALRDWANEGLMFDDVPRFLRFCEDEDYKATDVVSYTSFLVLKEKFERR